MWAKQSIFALDYNSVGYEEEHGLPPGKFTKAYGTFIVVCIISFSSSLYTLLMFIKLTELIIYNQTTWEVERRNVITYLKEYPKNFLPFHAGACNNIKMTFFHDNKLREWVPPDSTKSPKFMFASEGWCKIPWI